MANDELGFALLSDDTKQLPKSQLSYYQWAKQLPKPLLTYHQWALWYSLWQ